MDEGSTRKAVVKDPEFSLVGFLVAIKILLYKYQRKAGFGNDRKLLMRYWITRCQYTGKSRAEIHHARLYLYMETPFKGKSR